MFSLSPLYVYEVDEKKITNDNYLFCMHNIMWTHTTNHIHYIATKHMYHWDNKLDGFDVGFNDSFIKN